LENCVLAFPHTDIGEIDLAFKVTTFTIPCMLIIEVKCPSSKKARKTLIRHAKRQLDRYQPAFQALCPTYEVVSGTFDVYEGFEIHHGSSTPEIAEFLRIFASFVPPIMVDCSTHSVSVGTRDFYYRTFLNLLGMGDYDDPQLAAHRLIRIKDIIGTISNYFPLSWFNFCTAGKIVPTTLQTLVIAA